MSERSEQGATQIKLGSESRKMLAAGSANPHGPSSRIDMTWLTDFLCVTGVSQIVDMCEACDVMEDKICQPYWKP